MAAVKMLSVDLELLLQRLHGFITFDVVLDLAIGLCDVLLEFLQRFKPQPKLIKDKNASE